MEDLQKIRIAVSKQDINSLPTTTGIYIFWQKDEILYIGKSVNLKARLLSHLENAKLDSKEDAIVNNADRIECIITDSEFKALLFESELIQKYKPKYNTRWRDDKSYLYIKITTEDPFPKITATRRENNGKSEYFGPFPSIRSIQEMLREIRRVFPFCTQKKISKSQCFYSKIGQCYPCPNVVENLEDEEEKKRLKRMYRHNISQIIKVLNGNTDLVLTDLYKELKTLTKDEKYEEALIVRNRIERLENLIHRNIGGPEDSINYNQSAQIIESLLHLLQPYYPQLKEIHRVECYDISNLSQKQATASMVVFTDGLIDKKEYRKFKIKDLKSQSDFEMMDEVLKRRFKNDWTAPDVIVLDGGKPQVKVGQKVFKELTILTPFFGIAKHPDRLVLGIDKFPTIRPSVHHLGFNMIRALRDESHRFAKKYHVYLRNKKIFEN